ncbi:putative serine/threonine-protein kinase-like protein [Emericellopsis cladophorae]|uniref:non-specific serine/threonine protein kinase n=1 Tax=Emericellopsis cladophorae TaxID=2686198 RepID=A0A9P9Y1F1_9HYPO|nr:putative serine/threonine-protein kinase-like protein [Emericellopsis cladophorae]KAI6781403.1 putative serine/threonine-protein kinase-like protein [Emericellopsis cladophorae]
MGQGFSLATPAAGSTGIDIAQLSDVQYERSVGNARFMKGIRGRTENGVVLVKVLVKPYAEVKLDEHKRRLIEQRKALADVPNALAFQRIIETETNGYLVRQYLYTSLYDRLSTRPFLEDIEKKWLAFQLLCALRDSHARDIYHGDIKAQNVLVTSWNWLYLTDFSSAFKPVMLPDDNPGDFSYFFDSSGRRTCYIAPERFYASGETPPQKSKMTWAMDIFSAGCVIAQMFLESEIFSLAQLYKYRRGEYDPVITHLGVIADKDVREMIAHMIQLDPEKRYSADQYLDFWKDKVFPSYFYSFLHQYMELITDPSSGNSAMSSIEKNLGESDDRIDRVYYDFDKISYFLGYPQREGQREALQLQSRLSLDHFPMRLGIPNHEYSLSSDLEPPEDDGTLIFLTIVVSSLRTTARASSRVRACDVLLAFAERLTDEAKLDRVLPYLMTLLSKENEKDIVMISAIRAITQLLQLVRTVTPINSHVVVEYVLPRMEIALGSKSRKASPLVRATYAACVGSLASTAQRFLEMASSLRADGSMPIADPEVEPGADAEANFENVFDNAGRQLFEVLEGHTKQLVEDPDVNVRRAFLASVPELCMFFQDHSNDILLTHLNTYLNDRDWQLKCAFFDTIVGIAVFIGGPSLEEFMLPLMVQALADTEEHVVQSALHSLAQLASLGLLSRGTLWDLADLVGRFTMHPNLWIREAAAEFVSMSACHLDAADKICILSPLVQPYFRIPGISDFDELTILDTLKRPLSRPVYDQALAWATKAEKGLFWKALQSARPSGAGALGNMVAKSSKDLTEGSISKMAHNEEDDHWLGRMRQLGLKQEDELKLTALREYIWRLSRMKSRDASTGESSPASGLIPLQKLGVTPQTIFFNEEPLHFPDKAPDLTPSGPYTIADALLDASMTIDDSVGKRRRAALNMHKNRVHSVGPRANSQRFASPAAHGRASSMDTRALGHQRTASSESVDGPYSVRRAIRQSSSALNLLDRKDGNKSVPETGTTDTTAFGEMEGPFVQEGEPVTPAANASGALRTEKNKSSKHSYEGNDPNIQKMLDNMYMEVFPRDVKDFGATVTPISRDRSNTIMSQGKREGWRPQGKLVATFGEHKGPIMRVVPSPDHVFFITGSHDGTVKVWDTARLERNITHRSRQTHTQGTEGTKITALTFVENTHCFVSCAGDGSVSVVRVDTVTNAGIVRYGKLRVLREYQLPDGEWAVWAEHFRHEQVSVLLIATNRSRILGVDLRTMSLMYVLENPVRHGTPTCLCVDKKRNWVCVGTSHGVVDVWDLRFRIRLKGWGVPGQGCIYRMSLHPTKGRGKWVCIAGGTLQGEVTVWDLERATCREIYRTASAKEGPKSYEAWDVDDDKGGMLGRFGTNLESSEAANADRGMRTMLVGCDPPEGREIRHAFMITGGSDKRLRFWDIPRPDHSTIYSGLQTDDAKPTYTTSNPVTGLTINTERFPRPTQPAATKGKPSSTSGGSGRPARHTVISQHQQQLLQSHLDGIMDVALLEHPYTMSVSVDRSGVVFIFQ